MAITKELKIESVVIIATNFNPSIVAPAWLKKKGICGDDDILPNTFCTPQFSQIVGNDFQLLVLPDQAQFLKPATFRENFALVVEKRMVTFIKNLPEVPYKSAGINFHWFLHRPGETLSKFTQELFYDEKFPIFKEFKDANSNFGAYLSKDFGDARLKLDIKPLVYQELNQANGEAIQFTFNFHIDLPIEKTHDKLLEFIGRYTKYSEEAARLINIYA